MDDKTRYAIEILYPTGDYSLNVMEDGFDPESSLKDALEHVKSRMVIPGREIVESKQGFDVSVLKADDGRPDTRGNLGSEDLESRTYAEFCTVGERDMLGETQTWGHVYLVLRPRKEE